MKEAQVIASNQEKKVAVNDIPLNYNPFAPDTGKPLMLDTWLAKYEFIQHLTMFNNVLMTLLGEAGSGKTTFLSFLKEQMDEKISLSSQDALAITDWEQLFARLLVDFDLKNTTKPEILALIEQVNLRKKHCLLVLDNADSLNQELIQELIKGIKSQGMHGYFHVLLASDYSILEYLGSNLEVDNEGLVHSIEFHELSPKEIKRYLVASLDKAGYQGEFPLKFHEFNQMIKSCDGNIGKINQFMYEYLQQQKQSVTKNLEFKVNSKGILTRVTKIAATALPLFLVALSIAYVLPESSVSQSLVSTKPEAIKKERIGASSLLEKTSGGENIQGNALFFNQNEQKELSIIEEKVAENSRTQVKSKILHATDKVVFAPKLSDEIPAHQQASLRHDETLSSRLVPVPLNIVAAKEGLPLKNLGLSSVVVSADKHIAEKKPRSKPRLKPRKITSVKPRPNAVLGSTKRHKSSASTPRYMIQLIATRDLISLKRYVKTRKLEKQKIRYYRVDAKNQTWYVLGLGQFSSRDEAKSMAASLPRKLIQNKPWIRDCSKLREIS